MAHHKKRSWLVAVLAGLAGLAVLLLAYLSLGVATRVIAMCGGAPNWWVYVYFGLAFLLPVLAVWLGVKAKRAYLRRHASTMAAFVRLEGGA
jgi:uncharacterized membrane protein